MQLFNVMAGAKISDSTGSIRVIRDGVTVYLKAGDALQQGDVVALSSSDKMVLSDEFSGKTTSVLTENGLFNAPSSSFSLGSHADETSGESFFNSFFGSHDGQSTFSSLLAESLGKSLGSYTATSFSIKGLSSTAIYLPGHSVVAQVVDNTSSSPVAAIIAVPGKGIVVDLGVDQSKAVTSSLSTNTLSSPTTTTQATTTTTSTTTTTAPPVQTININVILGTTTTTTSTLPPFVGTNGSDFYLMAPGGHNNVSLLGGDDTITTSGANFKSTDIVSGGSGFDTLIFSDASLINSSVWANKSGIDAIQLNADHNTINMSFYYGTDSGPGGLLVIYNGAYSIDSLQSMSGVVITGTGLVHLGDGVNNVIYAAEGVGINIASTAWTYWVYGNSGNDTLWLTNSSHTEGNFSGGAGFDAIRFTYAATSPYLGNYMGVEALQLTVDGNQIILNNNMVESADNHTLEIQNGSFTVTSLNTSLLESGNHAVIAGTGAVTLANRTNDDPMSNVAYGKDGVNTYVVGSNAHNYYYGGTGNDTYVMGTGVDTVNLGTGSNTVIFSDATVTSGDVLNAGSGSSNVLKILGAGQYMDLASYDNAMFKGISMIDVRGTGGNLIRLNIADVLALSDTSDTVYVRGDSDDQIGFAPGDAGWTQGSDQVVNGVTYHVFSSDSVDNAMVFVESGMDFAFDFEVSNNNYTLTSGTDVITPNPGDDTATTTNANFSASDVVNLGLGTDMLEFLDAANITTSNWANKSGIDILKLNANGNVVNLDLSYVPDTAVFEIRNQGYTITSLAARQASNVVIAGTGLVTLNASTNNYISIKEWTNANIVLAGAVYSVYGNTGSETYSVADANLKSTNTLSAGNGTDTLIMLDAVNMSAQDTQNFSGIEVVRLGANGNSLVFTDAFVGSANNDSVELQNGSYTVTSLDTSALTGANRVVLAGSGAVILANGVNNELYAKAAVITNVTGGTGNDTYHLGSGIDTVNLGAGDDVLVYSSFWGVSAADSINGGSDSGVLGSGDTLMFEGQNQYINFATLSNSIFQNFEVIDLLGSGQNGAQLQASDVLALSSSTDNLFIRGDANDYLALLTDEGNWTQGEDLDLDGTIYHVYDSDTTAAMVYVQENVNVVLSAIAGVDQTQTLTAGNDTIDLGIGDDTFVTSAANFNVADALSGGLGFDTIRFTNAVSLDYDDDALWSKTGIERLQFMADGNTLYLHNNTLTNGGPLELDNGIYTITNLKSGFAHVIIAGTGLVSLGDGVNNVVYAKEGVNTNIASTTWTYWFYGNSGNDTLWLTNSSHTEGVFSGGAGFDALRFTYAATGSYLGNYLGVEALQLTVDGNQIILDNNMVASADNHTLEIQNSNFTVTSLNATLLESGNHVVIAGTGAVQLAGSGSALDNVVYTKDGVNTTITGVNNVNAHTTVYGGSGDDTYNMSTGSDTISLGSGNDTFNLSSAGFAPADHIDGGSDSSTLGLGDVLRMVGSNQNLDLVNLDHDLIKGIELIDLTGSGNNSLSLDINSLLALGSSTGDLQVKGNAGDQVNLYMTSGIWTQGSDQVINGANYHSYTSVAANGAIVYIDDSITTLINQS